MSLAQNLTANQLFTEAFHWFFQTSQSDFVLTWTAASVNALVATSNFIKPSGLGEASDCSLFKLCHPVIFHIFHLSIFGMSEVLMGTAKNHEGRTRRLWGCCASSCITCYRAKKKKKKKGRRPMLEDVWVFFFFERGGRIPKRVLKSLQWTNWQWNEREAGC